MPSNSFSLALLFTIAWTASNQQSNNCALEALPETYLVGSGRLASLEVVKDRLICFPCRNMLLINVCEDNIHCINARHLLLLGCVQALDTLLTLMSVGHERTYLEDCDQQSLGSNLRFELQRPVNTDSPSSK